MCKHRLISVISKPTVSGGGRAIYQQVLWVRFLNHLFRQSLNWKSQWIRYSFVLLSLGEKIIEKVRMKYLHRTEQTLIKLDVELYQCWICSDYCNCSPTWWQSAVHTDKKMSTKRLLKIVSILFWKDMKVSLKVLHTQKWNSWLGLCQLPFFYPLSYKSEVVC